jgi:hypothetical protein
MSVRFALHSGTAEMLSAMKQVAIRNEISMTAGLPNTRMCDLRAVLRV